MFYMKKTELLRRTHAAFKALGDWIETLPDDVLFFKPEPAVWSIAENLEHLNISLNQSTLALRLPKILLKWMGGKSVPRAIYSYDELVAAYQQKLQEGGRATGKYVPQETGNRNTLITAWLYESARYEEALMRKWHEADLDSFFVPHPLLGRISIRELSYFTLYHTGHHFRIMQERREPTPVVSAMTDVVTIIQTS